MESSRGGGQGGIQQLLAAEQEAQHIVNAARTGNFSYFSTFLVSPTCLHSESKHKQLNTDDLVAENYPNLYIYK